MRDQELVEGARAIARDVMLPSGRRAKLAKVIDAHLPWFQAARQRGLEWDDVIEMLFAAGVTRPNGQRLTRGHVSSLVWRKLPAAQKSAQAKPKPQKAMVRPLDDPGSGNPDQLVTGPSPGKRVNRPAKMVERRSKPRGPEKDMEGTVDAAVEKDRVAHGDEASRTHSAPSSDDKRDVLAFMQRAARIRGKSNSS